VKCKGLLYRNYFTSNRLVLYGYTDFKCNQEKRERQSRRLQSEESNQEKCIHDEHNLEEAQSRGALARSLNRYY